LVARFTNRISWANFHWVSFLPEETPGDATRERFRSFVPSEPGIGLRIQKESKPAKIRMPRSNSGIRGRSSARAGPESRFKAS
jgi:hypothetical protein